MAESVGRQGQRGTHLLVPADGGERRSHERVGEVMPGPHVDTEREVGADAAEGGGGVHPPPGEVEDVTRTERELERRGPGTRLRDGGPVVGPGLVTQGCGVHGRAEPPVLLAAHLQHEDVVHVVVVAEAGALTGSDVGIGLHGMPELLSQRLAEVDERTPGAVEALQDDGRASGEEPQQLVVAHLVGDRRADTAALRELTVTERLPLSSDPEEGGPQAATRDELVDRSLGEELEQPSREVGGAGHERRGAPRVSRELGGVDGDEALERRAPTLLRGHPARRASGHQIELVGSAPAPPSAPPSWLSTSAPPSAGPSVSAPPSAPPSWLSTSAPPSAGPSVSAPPSAPPSWLCDVGSAVSGALGRRVVAGGLAHRVHRGVAHRFSSKGCGTTPDDAVVGHLPARGTSGTAHRARALTRSRRSPAEPLAADQVDQVVDPGTPLIAPARRPGGPQECGHVRWSKSPRVHAA